MTDKDLRLFNYHCAVGIGSCCSVAGGGEMIGMSVVSSTWEGALCHALSANTGQWAG